MERVNSSYCFDKMVTIMDELFIDHSASRLNELKQELNKFFVKSSCKEIMLTNNSDKLFFGMRVYVEISAEEVEEIIQGNKSVAYAKYYVEIDSKLIDPMIGLTGRELTAILLHEVGHIVYDTNTTDEVRNQIDLYLANSGDSINLTNNIHYRELLAYALKDAVMKSASLFAKFGNEEMIADAFVASCGFGQDLETGFRKVLRSSIYMNKDVDDRFIVLSWVLRLYKEISLKRLPAIKTLNKAKQLTASKLEKRELTNAVNRLNRIDDNLNENAFDDMKFRLNKKFARLKAKGVRGLRDDIYELNLRLRTIETEEDALYIIRTANTNISILEDYATEPDIPEIEKQELYNDLQELYSIRQKASKESVIREKYASMIQVVYPKL